MSTELEVILRGRVPGGLKNEIVQTLKDSYRNFGPKAPLKVDVYIVDRKSNMVDFLQEEELRLHIKATEEEDFMLCYDARRGAPRIIICAEKLAAISKMARVGAVRHEAAHTTLHGSLEYYIFQYSESNQHQAAIKGIDAHHLSRTIHLVSDAVKDFEVTRFLVDNKYVKCQLALALETIHPSEEDKKDWRTIQNKRQVRYLIKVALLKPILLVQPLLSLTDPKKIPLQQQVDLGRRLETLIEYMEESEKKKLLQVTNNIVDGLGPDTHRNVDFAMSQALELM